MANGLVTAGVVYSNDKGELGSGTLQGNAMFNPQGGLLELDDTSGKKLLEKGTLADSGANGLIAWGRWVDGKSKVKDDSGPGNGVGNGNLATLHYFAVASTPTGGTLGQFTSFASTAPTIQSNGNLVATGTVNTATGTFTAALTVLSAGTATYALTVPVSGQTFSLTGVATQTSLSTFSGISLITSTGTGCLLGACTGSLGNNVSVIGQIAGTDGSQAGVVYGFNSRLGNVSGVIVFKR